MNEKELLKLINSRDKEKSFSKRIVRLVIFLNIMFTIAIFFLFLKVGNEPTALIVAWFGFTTGELWILGSIKKKEVQEGED